MTTARIRPSLRPHPLRAGLPIAAEPITAEAPLANDLKQFLFAYLGGLVFFGTLLA